MFGGRESYCLPKNAAWNLVWSLQDCTWPGFMVMCWWSRALHITFGVLIMSLFLMECFLMARAVSLHTADWSCGFEHSYLFFAWVYSCAELSFTYFLVLLQCLINIYKGLWHPVMKGTLQVFNSGIILLVKMQEESEGYQFWIQSEQWSCSVTLSRSCSLLFCNISWESSVLQHVLLNAIFSSPKSILREKR